MVVVMASEQMKMMGGWRWRVDEDRSQEELQGSLPRLATWEVILSPAFACDKYDPHIYQINSDFHECGATWLIFT